MRGQPSFLTFTVCCFIAVFETSFTQAQKGAIGVQALSPEAHVVFTAFVHIWDPKQERQKAHNQDTLKTVTIQVY